MVKRTQKPYQTTFARTLRQQQTDAERKVWNMLRNMQIDGVKFRRQHPMGKYIVDFVSLERKLVIEVDGGQHNEVKNKEKDENRTHWLNSEGYRVLRFWDNDVLTNTDGVYQVIREALPRS